MLDNFDERTQTFVKKWCESNPFLFLKYIINESIGTCALVHCVGLKYNGRKKE